MEEPDFRQLEITIVGLGLIGGSYALALRKMNPKRLWAIDIRRDVLEQAENRGIIDGGYIEGASVLKRSDLVIISVYPELTIRFVKENLSLFKPGSVLTDTAGIKKKVIDNIYGFLRDDLDFVGGHPLAGKECSGFAHASSDIFMGANYIVTPVPENKESSLRLMEKMIKGIGCREPILMNPAKHDEVIALTSQLPHLIAAALMNSSELENIGSLIGGSFRDATRVAKMNVKLWGELLMENKENVLTELDIFVDNITRLRNALQAENSTSLAELLNKANQAREKF
ncbi:MAG: prephenate dehydrogenase [Peptococcaceae bacterium]|nr:prephenate dehydrogenase [Peptococcaceae bacterium]